MSSAGALAAIESAEQKIAQLLATAARVTELLSKASVREYDKLKEHCREYLTLVQEVQSILAVQIRSCPPARHLKAMAHASALDARLSAAKLQLLRLQLEEISKNSEAHRR